MCNDPMLLNDLMLCSQFAWTIWDVGGQKKFREVWESYFQDIDILIWVVDSMCAPMLFMCATRVACPRRQVISIPSRLCECLSMGAFVVLLIQCTY